MQPLYYTSKPQILYSNLVTLEPEALEPSNPYALKDP